VIQLNRIACAVDFSDSSRHALDYALAVARWYEAELTVVHVFDDRPPVDVIPTTVSRFRHAPVQASRERQRQVLRDLGHFVRAADVKGVDVDEVVEEAPDIAAEILVQATVRKADLLVVGSHGQSGIRRFLLGSVAERVLRTSDTPTLVVPPRTDRVVSGQAAPFKRILCPIDFSPGSLNALAYAMALAEEADASLMLLHVVEIAPELREAADLAEFPIAQVRVKAEAACRARLDALVPDSVRACCAVDTAVAEGKPSSEIRHQAAAHDADLIVMGVQGRGAIDLMLFGSKTHDVVRAGHCPVLTVRNRHT
jgi:nucleotide-binding universal stress UspA family protein